MCIICLEFNKTHDLRDAGKMIEAARRESDVISEAHLKKIEQELKRRKAAAATNGPIIQPQDLVID